MTDPAIIFQGLLDRGIPPHVAEGIMMNFRDESGFDAGINEISPTVPGSRGGYGLYQLTGPRRRAYEQWAGANGYSLDDPMAQLDFMIIEGQGPERSAFDATLAAGSPQEAASVFASEFLRPAKANLDKRVAAYHGAAPDYAANALAQGTPPQPQVGNALAAYEPERPSYRLWTGFGEGMSSRWGQI